MFDAFGAVPKIRINSFGSVMNGVICDLRDGILRSITILDSCPYTELRLSDYCLGFLHYLLYGIKKILGLS